MSKRHFDEYVKQVMKDYQEILDDIKDLEKEVSENMTDPDVLDNFKAGIQPVMDNYERVMYLKFLLDKPNKKDKEKKYNSMNRKFLSKISPSNTAGETLKESKTALERVKGMFNKD